MRRGAVFSAGGGIGSGAGVGNLFNPMSWVRALGQPLVIVGLVVDLFPIYGVIAFGWNAVPLVMLYWMENIIAGVMTLPRIFISGATFGAGGLAMGTFLSAFFVFHYGLFCAVHGTFLMLFIAMGNGTMTEQEPIMMDVFGMFNFGMNSGLHVDWFVYAIIAFQVLVFVWEFLIKGEWKNTNPMVEMFAPYGRIIVLHFAIFAGAGALFVLGQPIVGVLALIVFRAIYGVVTNSPEAFGFETGINKALKAASGREYFEKAMRGENPNMDEDGKGPQGR
ncbi:MAG: hypothetical protein B7Z38_03160 [Rhodobacterales bacterium 12-64-8]|nr:MAG: hypothetical protein B7Z38_03160 [Rhodobacterales bacterium 12-64-8]OYX50309.1 MAG: hypothetical protein B7Y90_04870 [Alphaproteobacteria bacterium 32-64-14]